MRALSAGVSAGLMGVVLLGCAPEPVAPASLDTASLDTSVTTDTATVDPSVPPPPSLDAAGVEAEAATLLAGLPNAADVLQDWRDLFLGTTPGCPGITGPFSIVAPFSGCLAEDGRIWAGYAVYTEGDAEKIDVLLEADASVTDADGATFVAAGKASLTITEAGAFDAAVSGTWGGAGHDDWTGAGPSVAVWATGDAASVALTGGVSLDGAAIYLSEVTWDAATCPEGAGELAIRDPGGWWYTLVLDADCGGCGALRYVDTDLGRACVPLGAVLAALADATLAPPPEDG
ncbi:MAG: hypothetical protein Q8P41_32345 [Pseudomonadota bacterium]|nr:hypothetical protein [Pseudomonadota bacterium]